MQRFLAVGGELMHGVASDEQYFFWREFRYAVVVVALGHERLVKGVEFPGERRGVRRDTHTNAI